VSCQSKVPTNMGILSHQVEHAEDFQALPTEIAISSNAVRMNSSTKVPIGLGVFVTFMLLVALRHASGRDGSSFLSLQSLYVLPSTHRVQSK